MRSRAWRLRAGAGALGLGAAFALHQLRFLIAYHGAAHHELARQGHGYLRVLVALVPAVLVLTALHFAGSLAAARRGAGAEAPSPRVRVLWPAASMGLFALYAVQESLEGLLESGHPVGLAGVLGHGGWVAVPLALLLGLVVALLLRGAAAIVGYVAGRAPRGAPRRPARSLLRLPRISPAPLEPLACHLAGRGPPTSFA